MVFLINSSQEGGGANWFFNGETLQTLDGLPTLISSFLLLAETVKHPVAVLGSDALLEHTQFACVFSDIQPTQADELEGFGPLAGINVNTNRRAIAKCKTC